MPQIHRSAIVPYHPEQMFTLVNDINAYPQFLPWCRSAKVQWQSAEEILASVEISKGGLHKAFTTRNRLQPFEQIEIQLVSGPFRSLSGIWRFMPLERHGCEISLRMEFELANRLLAFTLGPVFSQIANSLVDAFQKRAHELYSDDTR